MTIVKPKLLGSGSFGKVFEGCYRSDQSKKVAIKVLEKAKMKHNYASIKNECQILKRLDHPNIIKYLGVYEDEANVFIITELIEGRDLFDVYCEKTVSMNENDAAKLVSTIIKALIHCHSNGVVHRDIKLENIMFTTKDEKILDYSDIKLIDFGLATNDKSSFRMLSTLVGSPYYTAPEVFEGKYDQS